MTDCDLYLASRSPRRRRLLRQLGVRFACLDTQVDETLRPGESAAELVRRLALAKARSGWSQAPQRLPVLGADTEVVLDGEVLGKPADVHGAAAMLRRLSGRSHEVHSSVALVSDIESALSSVTRVRFRPLSPSEIERYCQSGEPIGKAGAYAIQGFAAAFVEHIDGSYSGVVGLPLFETAALLQRAGIVLGAARAS